MFLPPESNKAKLELEIVKNLSGTRLYINLLFSQAPPCPSDPSRTTAQIIFESEEDPWTVYPFLFEGGQRLLLPDDVADYLIEALLSGCSFTVKLGRYQTTIISEGFQKGYADLSKISYNTI